MLERFPRLPGPALLRTAVVLAAVAAAPAIAQGDEPTPPWSDRTTEHPFDPPGLLQLQGRLSADELGRLTALGERLFSHRFTEHEGGSRPMATQAILPTKRRRPPRQAYSRTAGLDANSCASCHHAPITGGAGDFSANVFVSEGFQQADFDTTDPQFSNERNTNHLFGAGLIELLAREMSAELQASRAALLKQASDGGETVTGSLQAKTVDFGTLTVHPDGRVDTRSIDGVDADLVIRPFSQKGVMTSLRQFTVNALNHHHGVQADERFSARWTDEADFDEDGRVDEIGALGISSLVAWQATLAPPATHVPSDIVISTDRRTAWGAAAARGRDGFDTMGCAGCHRPTLPLDALVFDDPGPLDAAGTLRHGEVPGLQYDLALLPWAAKLERDAQGRVLVPLFGDLKRHTISDRQVDALGNELLSQRFVERNVFQTAELWGVGSTAPYGHRGDLDTLSAVIAAHGGDARPARKAWLDSEQATRDDVLAFLKTLNLTD